MPHRWQVDAYDEGVEQRDFGNRPPDRLKKMLTEAGLRSQRLGVGTRGIIFAGRDREWFLAVQLTDDWLNVATTFCEVPDEPGMRGPLFEHTMRLNRALTLLKFVTVEKSLVLELDYRAEHVDGVVLANLIGHVLSCAQDQYPAVFRIVSGDATLQALEASMLAQQPMT
jgi:hypothetical protein